jgi:K+-transporting ATPase ATPase C chain
MSLYLRTNFLLFFVFTVLLGFAYPAICTLIVQQSFPHQAQGSLITKDGKVLGSELIGQNFSDPKYIWGRLSATSPGAYNAASSSGSNFSPANPALLDAVKARVDALRKADPGNNTRAGPAYQPGGGPVASPACGESPRYSGGDGRKPDKKTYGEPSIWYIG